MYGPDAERWRVALAEEALIAYFRPEYKDLLREWTGNTLAVRTMRSTGLRVLRVTVTSWLGLANFYSTHRPRPTRAHDILWVGGRDEASQPEYSADGSFESLVHRSLTPHLEVVEASGRVFEVFGPALPERSPWDAAIPSEDSLFGDDPVTRAQLFIASGPPSTREQANAPVKRSRTKRWLTTIAQWRSGGGCRG